MPSHRNSSNKISFSYSTYITSYQKSGEGRGVVGASQRRVEQAPANCRRLTDQAVTHFLSANQRGLLDVFPVLNLDLLATGNQAHIGNNLEKC